MSHKFEGTFRQCMTWLHTWFGLVFCWIMYFIFITGTLGYFDTEIDRWMKPEVPVSRPMTIAESLLVADNYLTQQAPEATDWFIIPAKNRGQDNILASWQTPASATTEAIRKRASLYGDTGEVIDDGIRQTAGGQTLYRMHYRLHYLDRDVAYYFVGVITLLMFIGIVTGVVIHRKIFKDIFTFRSDKGARSWLDMHNLLSVSSLPFHFMISYSGLIFMVTTFLPIIAIGSYGFDAQLAREELPKLFARVETERTGIAAPLVPLQQIGEQLDRQFTPKDIRNINVQAPGDSNAKVVVSLIDGVATRGGEYIIFDGVSGEQMTRQSSSHNQAIFVANIFLSLHEGLFAGTALRWLYFVAGAVGSGMIATGAIYWVRKRQEKADRGLLGHGFYLVANINIGTIIGLLSAIAAYFCANRLLPLSMNHRAEWEVHIMFLIWLACLLHPFFRADKLTAWIEQCWFAAAAFIAIPVLNAVMTDKHLLHNLLTSEWVLASFDLIAIATSLLFMITATMLQRRQQSADTTKTTSTTQASTIQ